MSQERLQRGWIAAIIGCLVLPGVLAGQSDLLLPPVDAGSCIDRIPSDSMIRVAVYTDVDVVFPKDSSAKLILPPARALNRVAAWHVRNLLGAPDGEYPFGEPEVTWRGASGTLRVTAHRSGMASWANIDPKASGAAGTGVALVGKGLAAAKDAGVTFAWPTGVATDSVVFDLELASVSHDRKGKRKPPKVEAPEPLFSVMTPWTEPVYQIVSRGIEFPDALKGEGVEGFMTLTFVVDTSGRAEIATARDIWPSDRPRLTGRRAWYYETFMMAVLQGLPRSRYKPALVGGCPVRMWVQQSFDFRAAR